MGCVEKNLRFRKGVALMGQVYSHLSEDERLMIQGDLSQGWSVRKIAGEIGRSASTVSREIRRNTWFPSNDCEAYRPYRYPGLKTDYWTGCYYVAHKPEEKASKRRLKPVVRTLMIPPAGG